MFSWRSRRQVVALLIIAIPIVLFGFFLVTRALPEVSCFDKKQNQGELGVDCGGPCGPCELKNPKPLTLFWSRLVPVRENSYDVVALVQNPNEVLSSAKVDYEFTIFDGLRPVARITGSTFVYAQERMHIMEPNVKTLETPTHVEFKITNIDWQFDERTRPNFVIEKRDYSVEGQNNAKRSIVSARVLNSNLFDFKDVLVQAVVFDNDGNVLGSNRTIVTDFLAGTRREVKLPWPEELKGEALSVVVEARVNIFDSNTILTPR